MGLEVKICLLQGLTQFLTARAVMGTSVRWHGLWSLSSRAITRKRCWRVRSLPTSGKPSEAGPPIPVTRGNRIREGYVYPEEELRPGGGPLVSGHADKTSLNGDNGRANREKCRPLLAESTSCIATKGNLQTTG